jgi:hypothetical protein
MHSTHHLNSNLTCKPLSKALVVVLYVILTFTDLVGSWSIAHLKFGECTTLSVLYSAAGMGVKRLFDSLMPGKLINLHPFS